MKPYTYPHDDHRAGLRDYFFGSEPYERPQSRRVSFTRGLIVGILIGIVIGLALP